MITNNGTIINESGGSITNKSDGTIKNNNGGRITNNEMITNSGKITNESDGTITNNNRIINGHDIANDGEKMITNNGTIINESGGSITNKSNGTIKNNNGGRITNNEMITNSGTITNDGVIFNVGKTEGTEPANYKVKFVPWKNDPATYLRGLDNQQVADILTEFKDDVDALDIFVASYGEAILGNMTDIPEAELQAAVNAKTADILAKMTAADAAAILTDTSINVNAAAILAAMAVNDEGRKKAADILAAKNENSTAIISDAKAAAILGTAIILDAKAAAILAAMAVNDEGEKGC